MTSGKIRPSCSMIASKSGVTSSNCRQIEGITPADRRFRRTNRGSDKTKRRKGPKRTTFAVTGKNCITTVAAATTKILKREFHSSVYSRASVGRLRELAFEHEPSYLPT